MGIQVLVDNPDELEKIRQEELNICKERCMRIIETGANVVICTKGIDDFALKYFVEKGILALRRVKKEDMRKIKDEWERKVREDELEHQRKIAEIASKHSIQIGNL